SSIPATRPTSAGVTTCSPSASPSIHVGTAPPPPSPEMPDPARSTASLHVPLSAPRRRHAPDHARHRPEPVTVTDSTPPPLGPARPRLRRGAQRSTAGRRELVELLQRAGRPLAMYEIVGRAGGLPQSAIYRNLRVLQRVGGVAQSPG